MGRPLKFDSAEILEKAMNVFWRRGYTATSIQDLLDEMGINRFTLYAEFGGKQSLFAAVLDHYRESCVSAALGISVLARAGTGLNSASEYVERVLVSIR